MSYSRAKYKLTIGVKLSIVAVVGIILVVLMVTTNVYSGLASLAHAEREGRQIEIVAHLTQATVDLREMQMSSRDMRLARTPSEVDEAYAAEEDRYEEMATSMGAAEQLMGVPENIEQVKKAHDAAQAYLVQSERLLKVLKAQMELGATGAADTTGLAAQRAEIQDKMDTAVADVVAQMEDIVGRAEQLGEEAAHQTTAEIAQGQVIGTLFGALVVLTLIGSAVFGARAIAQPIRRITASMAKLADGDLSIDVPYVGRADELGDMAAAVQVFKENATKVAELGRDEAERARLASERAQRMQSFQARFADVIEAAVAGDFSRRIGPSSAIRTLTG